MIAFDSGHRPSRPSMECSRRDVSPAGGKIDWTRELQADWLPMVVEPCAFLIHQEYEVDAERVFGFDARQRRCYYAHTFLLPSSRSDDDEEFYSVVAYAESVHAWLLRDERWLVHRLVHVDEDCPSSHSFYAFSASCPG